jgi:flagellar motor switch protein FliG
MTIKKAAEILAYLDIPIADSVINNLAKYDIDLKDTVVKNIFTFEDLKNLFDQELQLVIQNTVDADWQIALRKSSNEIKKMVLKNMSYRRRHELLDSLMSNKAEKESKIIESQKKILDIALNMNRKQQIQMRKIKKNETLI